MFKSVLIRLSIFGSTLISWNIYKQYKCDKLFKKDSNFTITGPHNRVSEVLVACYNQNTPFNSSVNFVADIVEKYLPSVVTIKKRHLFGEMISGSGFFIGNDGYILTNAHVVAGQQKLIVILHNQKQLDAFVYAVDHDVDLALLKTRNNFRSLEPFTLSNPREIRTGEFVVAFGSPMHLSNSVSFGIISSTPRTSQQLNHGINVEFIQTDAAINTGSSGGPLVNMKGHVVGVNTMRHAFGEGLSFAISASTISSFLESVKTSSSENLCNFNVKLENVSLMDKLFGMSLTSNQGFGLIIESIDTHSPFVKYGFSKGDIINKIHGIPITSVTQIETLIKTIKIENCHKRRLSRTLINSNRSLDNITSKCTFEIKRNDSIAQIDIPIQIFC